MNSIILVARDGMSDQSEEVSGVRFALLENDVRHMAGDVADIKKTSKDTSEAIQLIGKSFAVLTEHVEQNKKMAPRIEKLERRVDRVDLKMAAYAGAAAAMIFIITKYDKVSAFFG